MLGRGRKYEDLDVNPLTAHLLTWFIDLNECRKYTVKVSMGGGGSFPDALSHMEILSWTQLTGNAPTSWELDTLRSMDRAWRDGYGERKGHGGGTTSPAMQHQALGEYCGGEKVEKCRKTFGTQLDKICATCPN